MIVMKFGGSSVKDAQKFLEVAEIVKSRLDKKPIVVLSAVKGVTDNLIKALSESIHGKFDSYKEIEAKHKEILKGLELDQSTVDDELKELKEALDVNSKLKEDNHKILDYISFFGERMSSKILSALLVKQGIASNYHISGDIGLQTDSNFGDATFLESSYEVMHKNLAGADYVPVITGFGGKDENGEFTTFNRGGSDYVASLVGAGVRSEEIQIWTDVNGVMTTDPRIVPEARTIPELSFAEAAELAFFGAKVLHPKTIKPAMDKNIPVKVLNTYEPENPGTTIVPASNVQSGVMKAIASKKNVTILNLCSARMLNAYGYLAKVFEVFNKNKKSVDMITTSEVNLSITVDSEDKLDKIAAELEKYGNVKIDTNKALVCVVGEGMKQTPGILGELFSILGKDNINIDMISQGASEINVSFIVNNIDADKVVKVLHKAFF
ncbi:MAG: aspartate kinase [Nanoarchaeota archaeon]|nr:aspartate kinase [Nanoarchaeota archaeon]MBU1704632.1 aspartate kinase [Nanoarchaeota archaeon]